MAIMFILIPCLTRRIGFEKAEKMASDSCLVIERCDHSGRRAFSDGTKTESNAPFYLDSPEKVPI